MVEELSGSALARVNVCRVACDIAQKHYALTYISPLPKRTRTRRLTQFRGLNVYKFAFYF